MNFITKHEENEFFKLNAFVSSWQKLLQCKALTTLNRNSKSTTV